MSYEYTTAEGYTKVDNAKYIEYQANSVVAMPISPYAGVLAAGGTVAISDVYLPFGDIVGVGIIIVGVIVIAVAEHTKNARSSTQEKHWKGHERKDKDQGGEKKEQKKKWKPNPNKRK